jgi:hypothetical protein
MTIHYPIPWLILSKLVIAMILQRRRSFSMDAKGWLQGLSPPIRVLGDQHIPANGPLLITINHYSSEGFPSWWIALAVSATFKREVHWIQTDSWRYDDPLLRHTITPLTKFVFKRAARVYDFTTMAPMPPDPKDLNSRMQSIRQVLQFIRNSNEPVVGLAPEGKDSNDGVLDDPPPGVGRFIWQMQREGLMLLPAGIYEENCALNLRYGEVYTLPAVESISTSERDDFINSHVMERIAGLLPEVLRGSFG